MEQVSLKKASADDVQLLHRLKYEAFLPLYNVYKDDETNPVKESIDNLLPKLTAKDSDYYIVEAGSTPVGGVRAVSSREGDMSICRISPLFITPEYQNRGIAQQAMRTLMSMYEPDLWTLSTIKQEAGNCHLYEKLGFHPTGQELIINERMTIIYYELAADKPKDDAARN